MTRALRCETGNSEARLAAARVAMCKAAALLASLRDRPETTGSARKAIGKVLALLMDEVHS